MTVFLNMKLREVNGNTGLLNLEDYHFIIIILAHCLYLGKESVKKVLSNRRVL